VVTAAIVVAAAVIAALLAASSSSDAVRVQTGARSTRLLLHALSSSADSTAESTSTRLAASIPAADRPTCPTSSDPSFSTPAAQFPNGQHGLGIPFVAALTQGELISGYHEGKPVGPKGHQSKWGLTLTGITGWVTGLLEVPSLQTVVSQTTGIMFCDDAGYVPDGKASEAPPRLKFTLVNDDKKADNTQNFDPTEKAGAYAPDFFSLSATAPPALNVSGVEPDGAIDLSGSTAAETHVAIWNALSPGKYTHLQTCIETPGTVINIGSKVGPEPAGGPAGATLQFQPGPLTGGFPASDPADPASTTLVGNNFTVNAFPLPPTGCGFSIALDAALSGFNKQDVGNYFSDPTNKVASPPGWSQITIKATITTLDIPVGAERGLGL
jgi:hypothetical protein